MRWFLVGSLCLHLLVSLIVSVYPNFFFQESPKDFSSRADLVKDVPLPTRVLSEGEFRRIVETALVESKMKATPQDVARYAGERTQRVERETQAAGFGSQSGRVTPRSASSRTTPNVSDDIRALWKVPIEGQVREESESRPKEIAKGNLDALDPDVAIGANTLLNTDEYIYAGFFNRVKREVAPRWEPAIQRFLRSTQTLAEGTFATRYAFFVDEQGMIQDTQLLQSSGSRSLDDIAVRTLREVGRFPNPPQSLRSVGGLYRVELGFVVEYSKKRFQTDYVPDPRFQKN